MKSIASLVHATGTQFVLLPPSHAGVPKVFENVIADDRLRQSLLEQVQRFRGSVYLSDGAILPHELTADERHALPVDKNSWHVVALNQHGHVRACLRYQDENHASCFEDRWICHSALSRCPRWGSSFRRAVELEARSARLRDLSFGEVCGWAVAPERRWTADPLRIILATYGLLQLLGGCVGVATATFRHGSAHILRRIGLSSLSVDGVEMPAYYDPQYRCEMQVLRFDSRFPSPRYLPSVAAFSACLRTAPVVCSPALEHFPSRILRDSCLPDSHSFLVDNLLRLSHIVNSDGAGGVPYCYPVGNGGSPHEVFVDDVF